MKFDEHPRKQSTIINRPNPKLTTIKTTAKPEIIETDIDLDNAPMIQGSFEVTKTDADIAEKKIRTSTLRPFTITNSAVRMKTKKTTIEKVKPLPKVPENLTANILKLDNVTKPSEPTTTSRPYTPISSSTTTTEITTHEMQTKVQSTTSVPTTMTTTTTTTMKTISTPSVEEIVKQNPILPSIPQPTKRIDLTFDEAIIEEPDSILTTKSPVKNFPSPPLIDDQPWMPIQPSLGAVNFTAHDINVKFFDAITPSHNGPIYSDGVQILPRNKIRPPIQALTKTKPKAPSSVYQSFSNPGLMYGTHEIENLGNGLVKPYPIPVDLIGEQKPTGQNDLVLNKGEVLINDFRFKGSPSVPSSTAASSEITPPNSVELKEFEQSSPNISMTTNTEKISSIISTTTTAPFTDSSAFASTKESNEATNFGEFLLDMLKQTAFSNDSSSLSASTQMNSDSYESVEKRTEDIDLDAQETSSKIETNANVELLNSRTEDIDLPNDSDDHTEALEEIATAISSMGTLSFKNIKDYIMATTKSMVKETITEQPTTEARSERPNSSTLPSVSTLKTTLKPTTLTTTMTSTTLTPITNAMEDVSIEHSTASYIEVETVQYNPSASWEQPSLYPLESKWQYVNGSQFLPNTKTQTQKIFNETLQAWIVESPSEIQQHRIQPMKLQNHFERINEPIRNLSSIFDTLASRIDFNKKGTTRLPPSMSHFLPAHFPEAHQPPLVQTTQTTISTTPGPSTTISTPAEEELPVLLAHSTEESSYPSSAETMVGQAEVEMVDPTQYEQMLLIDRVSAALHPSSTPPSLITLMPVKSNSGLRSSGPASSSRGFPLISSPNKNNKKQIENTSFVVRTNLNVNSQ